MKNIVGTLIIIVFFGCQKPDNKLIKENKSLIEKNDFLLDSLSKIIKENQNLNKQNSSFDTSVETNTKNESETLTGLISALKFSTKSITSDTLPNIIYKNLVYEEDNSRDENTFDYKFLYRLSLLANPNRNTTNKFETDGSIQDVVRFANYTGNYEYYLHYLWKDIDRSPENIRSLFNKNKTLAYTLLKSGDSYNYSGFENTIKILLLSYKEIHNDKKLLNDLYKRTDSIRVLNDAIYDSIESNEMNNLITKFQDWEFVSYNEWAYSFWMRRNKEGNTETVYQIIKEFDDEMSRY